MPLQFCVESQWVTGRIQNRRGSLASQLSAPETINLLRKGELSPAVSPPGKKQALIPLNDSAPPKEPATSGLYISTLVVE